jgi:pyruvate,water dikinase
MAMQDHIRWFETLRASDIALVGGKTASLGELYAVLGKARKIAVPNGFGVTADAYRAALDAAQAWTQLGPLLDGIESAGPRALARRAAAARTIVYKATDAEELRAQIAKAYARLERQYGRQVPVAVRSSATAEDLPEASFAGQHDSFVNIRGADAVFQACRRCFASIFTDRAIVYRNNHGFDHRKVALSVAVMKMVRTDRGASGVTFTLDPESGFRDVVLVSGIYGLGENIVQGRVNPDEFFVHKPTFKSGHRAVLRRILGEKQQRMTFARGTRATTVNRGVPEAMRRKYCLSDSEVLTLAGQAIAIEEHYSALNGRPTPMDIEWAKDGMDGKLYIVQARPETAASRRPVGQIQTFSLKTDAEPIATGRAVGEKAASGKVRLIRTAKDLARFRAGEILVSDATTPDWQPVMKKAAGIVTDRGGSTCHAAIVARELGIPAVVGTQNATQKLKAGTVVTLSCCEGETGHVYSGRLPFHVEDVKLSDLPRPKTQVMVNLGDPDLAFRTAMLPNDGVGLARMEFIINEFIGVHPMALVELDKVPEGERRKIGTLTRGFARPRDFFVQRLSEGIGTIAAAFHPKPVIVRLSDFKTNEYAKLLGGAAFEPAEANPMLGFRGASRYAHPAYAAGFALECKALARVRKEMGLTNLKIMVPFCRREDEARRVLDAMARNGLRRGEDGLEIFVMCEIPNNVIRIDAFAALFDGFSIGSNDLTQLTLGVDRDSDTVAFDFDERDPGMVEMLRLAVEGARRNRRHVGICGEAPADHPETARELVKWGIDSISVNPGSLIRCLGVVSAAERSGSPPG